MKIDFIGDVHGHARELKELLRDLGYGIKAGCYRHPSRRIIFLGDYIDRGPEQRDVLEIVRDMVEGQAAQALLGNHELNAIGWATPNPSVEGGFLRPHSEKNRKQHDSFLNAVGEGSAEHMDWIHWFKELPLWIENDEFVAVHACWDPALLPVLRDITDPGNRLKAEFIQEVFTQNTDAYHAIEKLLKGPELNFPEGSGVTDNDGVYRTKFRYRWWFDYFENRPQEDLIQVNLSYKNTGMDGVNVQIDSRKIFFGHYWLNPERGIGPLADNLVCLDYSVAKRGKLAAYRHDFKEKLTKDRFVLVDVMNASYGPIP